MSYNARESARINAKEPPLGQYVETADYVIFKEDGVAKAKDGSTGAIAFQGTDASTVINDAINALSGGGSVFVKQPPTPYRTTDWIDIDTNNVSLVFQERFAEDGTPIVKVADGVDVGGIRIGYNSHCENIKIKNYGHHGNTNNQSAGAANLDGVIVEDAKNVVIKDGYFTRTHPYHEHGGGSGITVWTSGEFVKIIGNEINDIGDRGVQLSGNNILVEGNYIHDVFDRHVSLDATRGATITSSQFVTIINNQLLTNSAGSSIGSQGGPSDVVIANNIISSGSSGRKGITNNGGVPRQVVVGNYVHDCGEGGIRIWGDDIVCSDNYVENPGSGAGIEFINGNFTEISNNILDIGENDANGIEIGYPSSKLRIQGNTITRAGRHGIFFNTDGNSGPIHDCIISGNVINQPGRTADATYHSIFLDGGADNGSYRNIISDNIILNGGGNEPKYNLYINGSASVENKVSDNTFEGIISGSNAFRILSSDNMIQGNYITRVAGTTIYVSGDGNRIVNNRIEVNQGNIGIDVSSGTENGVKMNKFVPLGGSPSAFVSDSGTDTIVGHNEGYITENSGTATFSGDGTTTSFTIAHGLKETPTFYIVEGASAEAGAAEIDYITVDGTNITVNFKSAPASGTDNVVLSWRAVYR